MGHWRQQDLNSVEVILKVLYCWPHKKREPPIWSLFNRATVQPFFWQNWKWQASPPSLSSFLSFYCLHFSAYPMQNLPHFWMTSKSHGLRTTSSKWKMKLQFSFCLINHQVSMKHHSLSCCSTKNKNSPCCWVSFLTSIFLRLRVRVKE